MLRLDERHLRLLYIFIYIESLRYAYLYFRLYDIER